MILSRPVAPRARRSALMTASVPEFTMRTISTPGSMRHHFLRHFDFEAGRRTERQTADHAVVHGFQNVGMAVAEDHRPPRTHVVDVLQTVRVLDMWLPSALDDEAWRARRPHRKARTGRIDPARQHLAAAFKAVSPSWSISADVPLPDSVRQLLGVVGDEHVGPGAEDADGALAQNAVLVHRDPPLPPP